MNCDRNNMSVWRILIFTYKLKTIWIVQKARWRATYMRDIRTNNRKQRHLLLRATRMKQFWIQIGSDAQYRKRWVYENIACSILLWKFFLLFLYGERMLNVLPNIFSSDSSSSSSGIASIFYHSILRVHGVFRVVKQSFWFDNLIFNPLFCTNRLSLHGVSGFMGVKYIRITLW